jgi:DNA-binding transcriptional MocR family regulator
LAARFLKGVPYAAGSNGHHLWLPLPPRRSRMEFLRRLLDRGLAVVADDAFAVDPASPPAVRVALGAARTRAELAQGLQALAETFASAGQGTQVI